MNVVTFLMPFLVIAAIFALLPYVGGPILIRLNLKQSAEPQVIPFPLDQPSLPREVARDFQRVVDTLQPVGFEPVTGLALPRQSPKVKAILLLLANRQTRELTLATVMFMDTPTGPGKRIFHVEFVCRFRDGTVVLTSNAGILGVFSQRPTFVNGRFPMVRHVGQLYRLHRGMVKRHGNGEKAFRLDEEFGGDSAAYLTASVIEELESQVQSGYLYLSDREKVYRATCKGACLMAWKLLWPINAIRQAKRLQLAHRLMAELEAEREIAGD